MKMNKSDVGVLNRGDTVLVHGIKGIVCSVHEPEWINHKTRSKQVEFQGADIRVNGRSSYFHAADIEVLVNN
jgi:hypothetical protein